MKTITLTFGKADYGTLAINLLLRRNYRIKGEIILNIDDHSLFMGYYPQDETFRNLRLCFKMDIYK
jgi:hypothetical protein